ncbi:MAG: type II toxin-antitoxin system RelB/DinJ family antitoxin [Moraxellaceae bacterium]|nr:MAG: type II toxin-antitoxin system RelB/DinJ family antitoxin [Moraxellaceae bacterium]
MARIIFHIEDNPEEHAYTTKEQLLMKPLKSLRQPLQYVADQKKLLFKTIMASNDDTALLALVRERLADPQKGIRVSLDELDSESLPESGLHKNPHQ